MNTIHKKTAAKNDSKRLNPGVKWGSLFLLFTILAGANIWIFVTEDLSEGDKIEWSYYFVNEFSGTYLILILLPVLFWFFSRFPLDSGNWKYRLPIYLLVSVLFGAAHTSLMFGVRTVLYTWLEMGNYGEIYGVLSYRYLMEYGKQFLAFWVIYAVVLLVQKWQESQQQQLRASQLEQQLSRARLQALQMQLNPHFLFNTLHMISSEMYEDPRRADRMIAALSNMLRLTLNHKDQETHTLDKELEIVRLYTEIMMVRFEGTLEVAISIPEAVRTAQVPVFLLQPLLENAIKYSTESMKQARVSLTAHRQNNRLYILIEDNGPGLGKSTQNGIGLSNTLERLEQLYEEDHTFVLNNRAEGGLQLVLSIPFTD